MKTYTVTVKTEDRHPEMGYKGQYHVARDANGNWRSHGPYKGIKTDRELAEYLFHADEIAGVGRDGNGDPTIEIRED